MSKKVKSTLTKVSIILAIVVVLGLTIFVNLSGNGTLLRSQTAASTENFKVDGMMMKYFYFTNYQSYAGYAAYFGIDTSKSLKIQQCPYYENATWFDYFMNMTKTTVDELLALCEAAKEAGVELEAEDLDAIEANIATTKQTAKAVGYTLDQYLAATAGSGVKEKDLRNCLKLTTLASKYAEIYVDSLDYTPEELEAFYNEHKEDFDGIDYLVFKVNYEDFLPKGENGKPDKSDETKVTEAKATAKQWAERLAAATTADDFKAIVREYIVTTTETEEDDETNNGGETGGETGDGTEAGDGAETGDGTDSQAADTSEKTEEELKKEEEAKKKEEELNKKVEACLKIHVIKSKSGFADALNKWAYEAETKAGATYTDSATDDTTHSVYFLVKEAYRLDEIVRNVRHILLGTSSYKDDTKAQELLKELQDANFSDEKFKELVEKYSEDTGSLEDAGKYEDVARYYMVTEFDSWLFDAERQVNDADVVKTTYGWHIMQYLGEGEKSSWMVYVKDAMVDRDYDDLVEKYAERITYNAKAINAIEA